MKTLKLFQVLIFLILSAFLGSCSVITDIFEAGMGVGIFIVLALFVLIIIIIARMGRR